MHALVMHVMRYILVVWRCMKFSVNDDGVCGCETWFSLSWWLLACQTSKAMQPDDCFVGEWSGHVNR